MSMLIDYKIYMMIELMLKKCEDKSVKNSTNLNQYHNDSGSIDYVYEIRIDGGEDEDFMSSKIDLTLTFCFGENSSLPFIMVSYTDSWQENIKFFDVDKINKLRTRVEKIYTESREAQFEKMLTKTMDIFDIDESEIRELKIKNVLEYE